jgi:hypothetical protein
MKTQF